MASGSPNRASLKGDILAGILSLSLAGGVGALIEAKRRGILETADPTKVTKVSEEEVKQATATTKEISQDKIILEKYGGHIFDMKDLPDMKDESPDIKGRVYMRFNKKLEEKAPANKKPRAIVYLHGLGAHGWTGPNERKVIELTKKMQEGGDPVILIAPEDGYGHNRKNGDNESKRWKIFEDPDTLENLLKFAERFFGKRIEGVTLASFSGGDFGTYKAIKAGSDRVNKLAFFDSLAERGDKVNEVYAKWLKADKKRKLMNCFNDGHPEYDKGSKALAKALKAQKVDSNQVRTDKVKQEHKVSEQCFRNYTSSR